MPLDDDPDDEPLDDLGLILAIVLVLLLAWAGVVAVARAFFGGSEW